MFIFKAGTVLSLSGFSVVDDDSGDSATFTLDCGTSTGDFAIDATTGELSFSGAYDVDDGVTPTSVTCTVNVTDSGGLSDTVSLDIIISKFLAWKVFFLRQEFIYSD